MSFALHRTVVQRKYGSWRNSFSRYTLFCWGTPVIVSFLPFFVLYPKPYLPPDTTVNWHVYWCWINQPPQDGPHDHSIKVTVAVMQLVCYYIPLWLVIGGNVVFSILIQRHLRQQLRRYGRHTDSCDAYAYACACACACACTLFSSDQAPPSPLPLLSPFPPGCSPQTETAVKIPSSQCS